MNPFAIFDSTLLTLLATAVVLLGAFVVRRLQYWKKKKLPHLNQKWEQILFMSSPSHKFLEIYKEFKKNDLDHGGVYIGIAPFYMPVNLDRVKDVLSKDFQHFSSRGLYYNEKDDPVSAHLINIDGTKWKILRAKLSPTFTAGKLKMMFDTLLECGHPMIDYMEQKCSKKTPIDIKDVLARFTTDIIGSCAFGIDCNSFKEENSDFMKYGRRVIEVDKFTALKVLCGLTFPSLSRFLGVTILPKEVSNFYKRIVTNTVEYRENNNVFRNDFMQLLLNLKNNKNKEFGKLTMDELIAESFVFFVAGYETSSSTLTFCLSELACNQDIQQGVREEIKSTLNKYNGEVTYEALMDMKYMTQVIEETLRKYPPILALRRRCTEAYKLPGTDVVLDKGVNLGISVYGIHHDPEIYPNPEVFDPERFSEENKKSRHAYSWIPFGEGPRICIGLRFAMMEVKVALALLLPRFRLSLNEKTKYPIEFNINQFVLTAKDNIFLDAEKISQ